MNAADRRCDICHKPGADVELHIQLGFSTVKMIGSFVHGSCLVSTKRSQEQEDSK